MNNLVSFSEPPLPFFAIKEDRVSIEVDWDKIEAIARRVQSRPAALGMEGYESIALAMWIVRQTTMVACGASLESPT